MNSSSNFVFDSCCQRRIPSEFLRLNEQLTQTDLKRNLKNEQIIEIYSKFCSPIQRKLFGCDEKLKGPGDLWIDPKHRLRSDIKLTPLIVDKVQALTHQGILKIGEKIEKKIDMENSNLIKKAIEQTQKLQKFEADERIKFHIEKLNNEWECRINELVAQHESEKRSLIEFYGQTLLSSSSSLKCEESANDTKVRRNRLEMKNSSYDDADEQIKMISQASDEEERESWYYISDHQQQMREALMENFEENKRREIEKMKSECLKALDLQRELMLCRQITELMHMIAIIRQQSRLGLKNEAAQQQQNDDVDVMRGTTRRHQQQQQQAAEHSSSSSSLNHQSKSISRLLLETKTIHDKLHHRCQSSSDEFHLCQSLNSNEKFKNSLTLQSKLCDDIAATTDSATATVLDRFSSCDGKFRVMEEKTKKKSIPPTMKLETMAKTLTPTLSTHPSNADVDMEQQSSTTVVGTEASKYRIKDSLDLHRNRHVSLDGKETDDDVPISDGFFPTRILSLSHELKTFYDENRCNLLASVDSLELLVNSGYSLSNKKSSPNPSTTIKVDDNDVNAAFGLLQRKLPPYMMTPKASKIKLGFTWKMSENDDDKDGRQESLSVPRLRFGRTSDENEKTFSNKRRGSILRSSLDTATQQQQYKELMDSLDKKIYEHFSGFKIDEILKFLCE